LRLLGAVLLMACLRLDAAEAPAELARRAMQDAAQVQIDVQPGTFDAERVRRDAEAALARAREDIARQAAERRARTEVTVSISAAGLQIDAPPDAAATEDSETKLAGRLVVAISASMPEEIVREYARQLDGVPEAILVLRGFIGGARTVKPTVEWIERVLRKHPGDHEGPHYRVDIVVDPIAYRMLGIRQVPAFTYLPGVQDLSHCDAEVLSAARMVYGAVAISGALQALAPAIAVPERIVRQTGGRP
jgi:type-F conjugative transfer system pilin assembly protein TrbC